MGRRQPLPFDASWLPICGSYTHSFASQDEATSFVAWVKRQTPRPSRPYVTRTRGGFPNGEVEVTVSNW